MTNEELKDTTIQDQSQGIDSNAESVVMDDSENEIKYKIQDFEGPLDLLLHLVKEKKKDIKIVAVEPKDSAVLSGGKAGAHGLQGIGAGFIPEVLDTEIFDTVISVTTQEAYASARLLGTQEGVLAGISSGAALHAAVEEAKKAENHGKTVVVLLPDTGDRYLSTDLF